MELIGSSSPGQINPNDYKIGVFCFFSKLASIRSKSKGWWARNKNNVSEWSDIYRLVLVCQHYKSPGKRVGLVQRGYHH